MLLFVCINKKKKKLRNNYLDKIKEKILKEKKVQKINMEITTLKGNKPFFLWLI